VGTWWRGGVRFVDGRKNKEEEGGNVNCVYGLVVS
jgi:hypothetical protein